MIDDDELLPWDEEDEALAQGISPAVVSDAYDQGVAAGRVVERAKVVAFLREKSVEQRAVRKGTDPIFDMLIDGVADTFDRVASAVEHLEHVLAAVPDKT